MVKLDFIGMFFQFFSLCRVCQEFSFKTVWHLENNRMNSVFLDDPRDHPVYRAVEK